jgi:hypothetical protein
LTSGPLPLLFNLETDPGEAYNLITRHPELGKQLMTQWSMGNAAVFQDAIGEKSWG